MLLHRDVASTSLPVSAPSTAASAKPEESELSWVDSVLNNVPISDTNFDAENATDYGLPQVGDFADWSNFDWHARSPGELTLYIFFYIGGKVETSSLPFANQPACCKMKGEAGCMSLFVLGYQVSGFGFAGQISIGFVHFWVWSFPSQTYLLRKLQFLSL